MRKGLLAPTRNPLNRQPFPLTEKVQLLENYIKSGPVSTLGHPSNAEPAIFAIPAARVTASKPLPPALRGGAASFLVTRPQSVTTRYLPPSRPKNSYQSYCANFDSYHDKAHAEFVLPPLVASEVPVFRFSRYVTGEVSAAYYLSGNVSKVKPPARSGPVETTCFRQKAKSKVRRAAECSSVPLTTFVTLTFAPRKVYEETPELIECLRHPLLDDFMGPTFPVVDQVWAKSKLVNFRKALTMKTNRQIDCKLKELPPGKHKVHRAKHQLRFLWVAELQDSGNIHFHALTNKYIPVAYLRRIWSHGRSNIKKLNDAEHAARYMVKYMTKDERAIIKGNRYNISACLRDDSKPVSIDHAEGSNAVAMRKSLNLMRSLITENGGYVIGTGGFGCNIPHPRRSKAYRGQFGQVCWTKAINRKLHDSLLDTWFPVPF